jgi:hypothetical protein
MKAAENAIVNQHNGKYEASQVNGFNVLFNLKSEREEKYLLSFFEIFKNRIAGEKLFAYLQRLGLIAKLNNGSYRFIPKTRSSVLPIVCLYKTLNEKGYLKRMTHTEAGYYFCTAFGKHNQSKRLFYAGQLDTCKKYDDYFFHIPLHSDFTC